MRYGPNDCPFCGHNTVFDDTDSRNYHYIKCMGCGARGPIVPSSIQAIVSWDIVADEMEKKRPVLNYTDHKEAFLKAVRFPGEV